MTLNSTGTLDIDIFACWIFIRCWALRHIAASLNISFVEYMILCPIRLPFVSRVLLVQSHRLVISFKALEGICALSCTLHGIPPYQRPLPLYHDCHLYHAVTFLYHSPDLGFTIAKAINFAPFPLSELPPCPGPEPPVELSPEVLPYVRSPVGYIYCIRNICRSRWIYSLQQPFVLLPLHQLTLVLGIGQDLFCHLHQHDRCRHHRAHFV